MTTGVSFTVQLDDAALRERLDSMVARTADREPFLRNVLEHLLNSVQSNFKEERAPDGTPWEPLKAATKRGRARQKLSPLGILRARGTLYGSLRGQLTEDGVIIGARKPYARIHQFGGEIRVAARDGVIYRHANPKSKHGTRFVKKSLKGAVAIPVKRGGHLVPIPARPYLGLRAEDGPAIVRIAERWLSGG